MCTYLFISHRNLWLSRRKRTIRQTKMILFLLLLPLVIDLTSCYTEKPIALSDQFEKFGKSSHSLWPFLFLSNTTFIVDFSVFFFFTKKGNSFKCPPDLFRCDIVQCLSYGFVCNGEYNCQDKTDEANCSTAIINHNLCDITHSINCEQDILHSTRLANHGIKFEYIRPVQICIRRYGAELLIGVDRCLEGSLGHF